MTEQTAFNLESLLDGTLDDLPDLPEFKPFPPGAHRAMITLESKKINNHPAYVAKFKAVETIELSNPKEDKPLEAGVETSVSFMLDNEFGLGAFKKLLTAAAEKFGAKGNRDLISDLSGSEVLIITNIRQNKEKTQQYTNIVEMKVV